MPLCNGLDQGAERNTWRCADDVGSTVEQDRSHLAEPKLGTMENVADLLTKHVPRAVLDKLAGMMGYTLLDEETQKFQEYTNINQNYWDQKLAAIERLPVFDDGEKESLEDDVHSFVDKTNHLTPAVLRRCVEVNILLQPYLHRPP